MPVFPAPGDFMPADFSAVISLWHDLQLAEECFPSRAKPVKARCWKTAGLQEVV